MKTKVAAKRLVLMAFQGRAVSGVQSSMADKLTRSGFHCETHIDISPYHTLAGDELHVWHV